jgi:hypothetical protein
MAQNQKQLSVVVQAVDRLTAQTQQMAAQVANFANRTQAESKKAEAAWSRVGGAVRMVQGLLGGFLTVYSARRIFGSFSDAARQVDEVGKAAQRLGLGTEFVSELRYAGDLANISFEQLAEWLKVWQVRMAEFVRTGGGPAADALRRLNVPLRDNVGNLRSMEELLPEILESLGTIPDPAERLRRTLDVFGRSAAPLLQLTGEGLRVAADEARRLGAVFTPEQVRAAEAFNDAMTRVRMSWLGLRADLVRHAGPVLAEFLNRAASFIAAVPEMVGNLALTVRLALLGHQGPQRALEDWAGSLGGLLGAGIKGAARVAFTAAQAGANAVFGMLDARTEAWFETLLLKAPAWLGIAYNAAVKGLSRELGLDTAVYEERINSLRVLIDSISRKSADPFGDRLTDVLLEIEQAEDRLKRLDEAHLSGARLRQKFLGEGRRDEWDGSIWQRTLDEMVRVEIPQAEAGLRGLRAEAERLRGLVTATGPTAFEEMFAPVSGDVVGAVAAARGEVSAAAAEFLRATDGVIGYTEALARTSIAGVNAADAIRRLRGDIAATGEDTTFLGGIRHELERIEEQATNTFENARRLTGGVTDALVGGLGPAILDTAADAQRAGEIWRDALSGILRQVSELITRMLLLRAVSAIGSALFTPAAPSAFSGGFQDASFAGRGVAGGLVGPNRGGVITAHHTLRRFNTGDIVPGPRVNRDMVLGMLTPGEGVLNREAVARMGEHEVHRLNRGGSPEGGGPLISIGQVSVHVSGGGGGEQGGRQTASAFVRGLLDQLARMPQARDELRRMLA